MEALLYKGDYRISSVSTKIIYSELRIMTFFNQISVTFLTVEVFL